MARYAEGQLGLTSAAGGGRMAISQGGEFSHVGGGVYHLVARPARGLGHDSVPHRRRVGNQLQRGWHWEGIKAIKERFPQWHVYISDNLTAPEYAEGGMVEILAQIPRLTTYPKPQPASPLSTILLTTISKTPLV